MSSVICFDAALQYSVMSGWPVFPCHWQGEQRKRPLVDHGFQAATTDTDQIINWWEVWPEALIGLPTGAASGLVVLDIDVKDPKRNGYGTLEDLGHSILPDTPMAHTASGGLHLYFASPAYRELRNSAGKIGPGLDVRGEGGYVILPSPGSGYAWDPHWNFDTAAAVPAPDWLWPPEPERPAPGNRPILPQKISHYAEAALDHAIENIIKAPEGQQRDTLNRETFAIAGLVAGGVLPSALALDALKWAARRLISHDPHRPWNQTDKLVSAAFLDGLHHPRQPNGWR
jgi:Bifunctional DNA primase/polymerase, N-terminal